MTKFQKPPFSARAPLCKGGRVCYTFYEYDPIFLMEAFSMSTKQRLLFITTGGTIASVRTQQGLKPVLTSEELLAHLP